MRVTFIKYDQIVDRVAIGIEDPKNGFKRHDFTMEAFEALVEKNDPSYSDSMKRIRAALIDIGGTTWLKREIQRYQKKLVDGTESMVRERY